MRTILPPRDSREETPYAGEYPASDPWTSTSRAVVPTRRRSVPHLLLGILLVLACAVGALVLALQFSGSRPVLATTRAVTVGQVLTAADIRQVSLPVDSDVRAVDANSASALIGRPVAASLPAGALLTPESLGGAGAPPPGQAIVAVALEPGRLPLEVAPGDRVSLVAPGPGPGPAPAPVPVPVPVPANGGTASGRAVPRSWPGVVTSVEQSDTGQQTVVSVQLPEGLAREVAAAPPAQLAVVLTAAAG